ncbi:MAG: hypothetical protein ACE37D_01320 [Pseudomonadales bacterium]|jgi:hypothetical protein
MDRQALREQNQRFANTEGISVNNQDLGFVPAFRDPDTGRVEVARFQDGRLAPMHVISGLPAEWATELDASGAVLVVKPGIEAGFCRGGQFYTREQAISACQSC